MTRKFFWLVRYDLRFGVFAEWRYLLFIALIFMFPCLELFYNYSEIMKMPEILEIYPLENKLTFGDYILYAFKGTENFIPGDNNFRVNVFWILNNTYLSFFIGFYPFKDLSEVGQLVLLKSEKRYFWWLSKCIWITLSVFFYYLIAFIVILSFAFITGSLNIMPQENIQIYFSQVDISNLNMISFLKIIFQLLFASIALSLFQMLLALILKPIISFILIFSCLIISIFYTSFFLPGNSSMMIRSEYLCLTENIKFTDCFILSLFFICFSIILGSVIFTKYNIISNRS